MPSACVTRCQMRTAQEARALIYGIDARPYNNRNRAQWANIVRHWTRGTPYDVVLRVARELGAERRFVPPRCVKPERHKVLCRCPSDESAARAAFSARLKAAAPPFRNDPEHARRKVIQRAVYDALASGVCPACAQRLPCPCGTPEMERDGRGGLRPKSGGGDKSSEPAPRTP